ncbi:tyrosine-type recombinase/integrase [Ephemeroptericola cinctiostellae]|nr:tyrosine-type recombinase/integrase [Ephemeroptericola cinctiostellae]
MLREFEDFLIYKADNDGAADRTVRAYRDVLVRFEAWINGREPFGLSGEDLLVFTGPYLHKALRLNATSRTPYVACLRGLYAWRAEVAGGANPALILPYPKKGVTLPRVLSLSNAERLMWAPDFSKFEGVRDAAMMGLLIGCGLRVSGLVGLNEGSLVIQEVGGDVRTAIKPVEKGGKQRLIPVPKEADLLLRVYLAHPELEGIDRSVSGGDKVLFVTTRNRRCGAHDYYGERRRFSTRGVLKMIQRHGTAAGIPADQLHPHAMRHLYGTELAEENQDLLVRQSLLGHKSPKSTEIYTHLAMRKLTKVVDNANPMSKFNSPASQLLGNLTTPRTRR